VRYRPTGAGRAFPSHSSRRENPLHPQVEVDRRVELYIDRGPAPEGRASLVYVDPPASGARVLWIVPRRRRRLSARAHAAFLRYFGHRTIWCV